MTTVTTVTAMTTATAVNQLIVKEAPNKRWSIGSAFSRVSHGPRRCVCSLSVLL